MSTRFPEFTKLAVGRPVPIQSRNRCYFVRTADGRRWVLKVPAWPGAVLAEAIAHRLGRRLGLAQPEAAVFAGQFPGSRPRRGTPPPPARAATGWLSQLVEGTTQHKPYLVREAIANPETVAITMVLDLVLLVEDRHKGNMISSPGAEGLDRVVAIDFEDALVGNPEAFARLGNTVLPGWKWMPMVRRGTFDDLVDRVAGDLTSIDVHEIGGDVDDAEQAARLPGAARLLLPCLVERMRGVRELVDMMRNGGNREESDG